MKPATNIRKMRELPDNTRSEKAKLASIKRRNDRRAKGRKT